ncbi:hypothetical protein Pelo_11880 [Pelomyxa schiedti]|nr:hypothetical protein Pelo_11880 [Pelomyxa schiedti]
MRTYQHTSLFPDYDDEDDGDGDASSPIARNNAASGSNYFHIPSSSPSPLTLPRTTTTTTTTSTGSSRGAAASMAISGTNSPIIESRSPTGCGDGGGGGDGEGASECLMALATPGVLTDPEKYIAVAAETIVAGIVKPGVGTDQLMHDVIAFASAHEKEWTEALGKRAPRVLQSMASMMEATSSSEESQSLCANVLCSMCCLSLKIRDALPDSPALPALLKSTENAMNSPSLVGFTMVVLARLSTNDFTRPVLFTKDWAIVGTVLRAMSLHSNTKDIQSAGCQIIGNISYVAVKRTAQDMSSKTPNFLNSGPLDMVIKAIQLLIAALCTHKSDNDVQYRGSSALVNVTYHPEWCWFAHRLGAQNALYGALSSCSANPVVVSRALSALVNIAIDGRTTTRPITAQIPTTGASHASVESTATATAAALVAKTPPPPVDTCAAFTAVIAALKQHMDSANIITQGTRLIRLTALQDPSHLRILQKVGAVDCMIELINSPICDDSKVRVYVDRALESLQDPVSSTGWFTYIVAKIIGGADLSGIGVGVGPAVEDLELNSFAVIN